MSNRKQTKPQKYNHKIKVLREIKKYQETTDLLIKGLPFLRLVKEIAFSYNTEIKFQRAAIEALQESSEAFIVRLFELTGLLSSHAGRTTVLPRDIKHAQNIFNEFCQVPNKG